MIYLVLFFMIYSLFFIGSMHVSGKESDVEGFIFEKMEVSEIRRGK